MNDYYSVTEYAKLVGKDTGNIRRLLGKGLLPGEKLGKQWVIPKDAKYPEDRRVKSGNYKNWRKMKNVNKCSPHLMKSLKEMSGKIASIYGDSLDRIVLYGSYARGEQTDESDIDIALFMNEKDTDKRHDKMIDIVVDYELFLAVTLSIVPIENDNYEEWNTVLPFYRNIDREGIVLWKTA